MKKINISLALVMLLTIFSCTDGEKDIIPISRTWKVVALDDANVTKFNSTLIINAPQKQMGGTSGCNAFGGEATVDSISLKIDFGPIITTKIACLNDLGIFEQDYYTALSVIDGYLFEDNYETVFLTEKGKKRIKLLK